MTKDRIEDLLRQIQELRGALSGRTMSCSLCNDAARKQDVLIEQMASISAANVQHVHHRQNLLDAVRQFVRAERQYGQSRGHRWLKAFDKLCDLVADE